MIMTNNEQLLMDVVSSLYTEVVEERDNMTKRHVNEDFQFEQYKQEKIRLDSRIATLKEVSSLSLRLLKKQEVQK